MAKNCIKTECFRVAIHLLNIILQVILHHHPQATKLYEFYKFSVTLGCGGSSSENCTYFEVTGANDGACSAEICKIS